MAAALGNVYKNAPLMKRRLAEASSLRNRYAWHGMAVDITAASRSRRGLGDLWYLEWVWPHWIGMPII